MEWWGNSYQFEVRDPLFANVRCLLNGEEGANGSTTIVDRSSFGTILTAFGDAQISTARARFGNSSYYFDGSGDWIGSDLSQTHLALGSGDFAIEASTYQTTPSGGRCIYDGRTAVNDVTGIFFGTIFAGGQQQVYSDTLSLVGGTNVPANQWNDQAIIRSNGVLSIWLNGVQIASVANTTNLTRSSLSLGMSARGVAEPYIGWIDNYRITVGAARNPAIPITAPFPTF